MAEENTQDTKSPQPPRRGARPFVGPAGAAGQPLPLLRVTSMPRPAPFVPAAGARPTLGTSPQRTAPPTASAIAAERAAAGETPTVEPSAATAAAPPASAAESRTDGVPAEPVYPSPYDQFAAFDTTWHEAAIDVPPPPAALPSPTEAASLGGVEEVPVPPVSVTGDDATPGTPTPGPAWLMDDSEVPSVAETQPVPAHALLADASAPAERQDAAATDAATPDTAHTLPGDDGSWADVTIMASADSIMGAEIEAEDALHSTTGDLADDVLSAREWPDRLLAEYAPYLPTPAIATPAIATPAIATPAVVPDAAEEASAGPCEHAVDAASEVAATANPDIDSDVEDNSPMGLIAAWTSDGADADAALETHETRVAATLDRLAAQVRLGEIDVSSVTPVGPDAAVLAAVLAALLGGGRSSSR